MQTKPEKKNKANENLKTKNQNFNDGTRKQTKIFIETNLNDHDQR